MSPQESPGTPRTDADRCPGVFSTHAAADGAVARIRVPGGLISPDQLEAMARIADDHADGHLELTARGNVQLRGIRDTGAVASAVVAAGLAPGAEHDKVRNIVVTPLSGRVGGISDIRPAAARLDELLRSDSRAANLSGRFLFGLDDGRGDIVARGPDIAAVVRAHTDTGPDADILLGGVSVGSASGEAGIADALLLGAHRFLDLADGAWRLADLDDDRRAELRTRLGADLPPAVGGSPDVDDPAPAPGEPIVGWFGQDDGKVLLGSVVEYGRLPARLAKFLAAVGAPIIVTPDREILLADLDEGVAETVVRVLAPMGLIFDASSPWARVSACVGAPACAKSHADVRADLADRVRDGGPVTEREHWVGCDRCCGAPPDTHLSVEATGDGSYRTRAR